MIELILVGVSIHLSVWGAALFSVRKFERERVAFVAQKAEFQREQAVYAASRAIHAAGLSAARCKLCSTCGKVVHKYSEDSGSVVCHDCLKLR